MAFETEIVKTALKTLDWPLLLQHLDPLELSDDDLKEVASLAQQCEQLIVRHPDQHQQRRSSFMSSLQLYFDQRGRSEAIEELSRLYKLISCINKGYETILDFEKNIPSYQLSATQRVSALFTVLDEAHREVLSDAERALASGQPITANMKIPDSSGNLYYPSSVYHGLSASGGNILMMEAFREGWFNSTSELVLPMLPEEVQPDHPDLLKTNLVLAQTWRLWRDLDERARFLDASLTEYTEQMPDWVESAGQMAKEIRLAFEFTPNTDMEVHEWLSVQRFDERNGQNFFQMITQTNLLTKAKPTSAPVALPPTGLVSVEEGHAGVMLSQALSMRLDQARAGAVSVQECLRGYAVLQNLAKSSETASDTLFTKYSREQLLTEFTRCGLTITSAEEFLKIATFKRSSRDVYDQPLIRSFDDQFILFGLSMLRVDLTKTVLSNIANRKINLSKKGAPFEDSVLKTLTDNGFQAKKIKVKRGLDGAEYDYDVVFTWGDYAFFLECKNRGIPWGNAVATHYFYMELESHIRQVKRLMKGLTDYPDILQKEFPSAVGKKPIFCIVNALPFAMGATSEEIYLIDISMLGRFFESPTFGANRFILQGESATPVDRQEVTRIWSADKPTVEEFINYLADPPQLRIASTGLELRPKAVWLSDTVPVKVMELIKNELPPEEVKAVLDIQKGSKPL